MSLAIDRPNPIVFPVPFGIHRSLVQSSSHLANHLGYHLVMNHHTKRSRGTWSHIHPNQLLTYRPKPRFASLYRFQEIVDLIKLPSLHLALALSNVIGVL